MKKRQKLDGRAMQANGVASSSAEAAARQSRPTASLEPGLFWGHFVDFTNGCNQQRRYEDGRKLRRYVRRWIVERTNAWLAPVPPLAGSS